MAVYVGILGIIMREIIERLFKGNQRKISKPKYKLSVTDRRSRGKWWTQKDGTQRRIKDLDDIHLCNIIRGIIKRSEREMELAVANPPALNGEMAQMFAEMEYEALFEMDAVEYASGSHPLFDDLIAEAERRGLNYWEEWRDI